MPEPTRVSITLPSGMAVSIHADARMVHAVTVTPEGRFAYRSRPVTEKKESE